MSYTLRDGKIDASDIEIVGTSRSPSGIILGSNSNEVVTCGFCSLNLNDISVGERQQHCESHFQEPSIASPHLSHIPTSADKALFKKILHRKRKHIQEDVMFWSSSQSRNPPSNYTPGLMPLLRKALQDSQFAGNTQRAVLCYDLTTHVCCESWDRSWGCGYRNFLMTCTALMEQSIRPVYARLLNKPLAPGVRNLQAWIEDAWSAGFDKQGAKELKKLVGSNKWIGTADLWVAFTYRGLPAGLVDFNLKHEARGVDVVIEWIVAYFSTQLESTKPATVHDALLGASPIVRTERMPLILQHDGHSRTIVGYEVTKSGKVTLLTFDPSTTLDRDTKQHALMLWSRLSRNPSKDNIRRRSGENVSSVLPNAKRARSAGNEVTHISDGEDDVSIIHELQDSPPTKFPPGTSGKNHLDYRKLLKKFRLDAKKLGKKEYQILYFPMTEPLTDRQRMGSKIVVSTRIC